MISSAQLTIGTRGSPLALAQADLVRKAILSKSPELLPDAVRIQIIKTTGDHVLDRPLAEIGGKGLFTKEIEEALLDGTIDLAVHSMKDMPTELPPGLVIGAMLERADPRDVLLAPRAQRLSELPTGTIIGTSSLRRAAQVRYRRPDVQIVPLRGNVQTRLRKLQEGAIGATLLAAAGLDRLGMGAAGGALLEADEVLPAVAQGAIGIECRADDVVNRDLLSGIDHEPSHVCVNTERAVLAALDGSCKTPIAALARLEEQRLDLMALIALPDGSLLYSETRFGDRKAALEMGRDTGLALKARAGSSFFDRLQSWFGPAI